MLPKKYDLEALTFLKSPRSSTKCGEHCSYHRVATERRPENRLQEEKGAHLWSPEYNRSDKYTHFAFTQRHISRGYFSSRHSKDSQKAVEGLRPSFLEHFIQETK